MDSCNGETMEEVLTNVEECLQQEVENFKPTKEIMQKKNVSTEILNYVGECVEDHTAFPCVMKDKSLFNKFVQRLVQYSKSTGLKILDILSKGEKPKDGNKEDCEKYNYTRLCFKWMDYSRLESCEPDFIQYMMHLMNGKSSSALSQKVYGCFQEHLKVCPQDTVKTLITILVGALEGKSGKEPEQDEEAIQNSAEKPITILTPLTKPDKCGQKIINHWIEELKKCIGGKMRTSKQEKKYLQRYGVVMENCASEIPSTDCTVHKASQFTEISNQIIRLVLDNKPDSQTPEEEQACLKDIENPKLKNCIANLFLHFVSVNHAHYTSEAREKLLNKAKLCFQVTLKNCPFQTFIVKLIQTFAVVFRIKVPQLSKGEIISKVTIPEGSVWCETRIITKDVPIPPTRGMQRTPARPPYGQRHTPTTTRRHSAAVTRVRFTKTQTAPVTAAEIFKPTPKIHVATKRPTTTREEIYTITRTPKWKYFSPKPTEIIEHPFPMRTPKKERLTPTTIIWKTLFPQTKRPQREKPAHTTRFETQRPKRPEIKEKIRPTTIQAKIFPLPTRIGTRKEKAPPTKVATNIPEKTEGKQRIKPTVVVTRHFTIPTRQHTERVPAVPTKVQKITPSRGTKQETISPTTIIWKYRENKKASQLDIEMPRSTVTRHFTPAPRTRTAEKLPTTVRTYSIPRTRTTEGITRKGTTLRVHIIEKQEKVSLAEMKTVTPVLWVSTPAGVCELPVETGLCKPCLHRFYYEKRTGKCKTFTYCGCGESKNNFETEEKCQERCENNEEVGTGDSGSICLQPLDNGFCKPYYERYYFDVNTRQCRKFLWFGCAKNKNNFPTYKECERLCGGRQTYKPTSAERIKVTLPAKEIEKTRPTHLTKVFTRTRPTRVHHTVVTPTTTRSVSHPVPTDYRHETRAPAVPKPVVRQPKLKMIWKEIPGITKAYIHHTPRRPGYTKGIQPTTVKHKEIHIPTVIATVFKPQHTRVVTYTPRIGVVTEIDRLKKPKIIKVTAPKTRTKEKALPPTKKIDIRPPSRSTIAKRIRKTTVEQLHFTIPAKRIRLTHPTLQPTEKEMPGIVIVEKFQPTESQTIKIPAKPEEHTQAEIGTTVKIKIVELPGRTKERSVELPSTSMYQIEGNVCILPAESGLCKPCQEKYYYDKNTRKCQKFTFCGCGRNKNNFPTLEKCEKCCVNPGVEKGDSGSVCLQPVEPGYCKPYRERWFYDVTAKQCKVFIHFGCGKNGNNFPTKKDCEKRCGVTQHLTVTPELKIYTPPSVATHHPPWCIVVIPPVTRPDVTTFIPRTSRTTVPGPTLPVTPPKAASKVHIIRPSPRPTVRVIASKTPVEEYKATLPRITKGKTYPSASTIRMVWIEKQAPTKGAIVTYPATRIFTKPPPEKPTEKPIFPTEHKIITPPTKLDKITPPGHPTKIIIKVKTPPSYTQRKTQTTVIVEKYPRTSKRFSFTHLPATTKQIISYPPRHVCVLPVNPGLCKPCDVKYYYDKRTGKCQKFSFCGCDSNENNFPTLEKCQKCCENNAGVKKGDSESVCLQPVEPGYCKPYYERYYFDVHTEVCKSFIWFGCAVNGNNFPTKEDCEKICGVTQVTLTETTARTARRTVPLTTVTKMQIGTTTKGTNIRLPEKIVTWEEEVPSTEKRTFKPPTKATQHHVTRTTVRPVALPRLTPTIAEGEKPLPKTKIVTVLPPRTEKTKYLTWSTSKIYERTPASRIWITRPAPITIPYTILPPRPPYTEIQRPTTTSIIHRTFTRPMITVTMPPPRRSIKHLPPKPRTKRIEKHFTTQTIEVGLTSKGYTCTYPTRKPYVTCKIVPQKCTESVIQRWIAKIRECTKEMLKEINKTLLDYVDCVTQELKDIVLKCVRKIGDTKCRNTTFSLAEWVLEKDVYVSGSLGERAEIGYEKSEDNYEVEHCVALIDEANMEKCFPGFYKALTDILVYKKGHVQIEIAKQQPTECLANSMKHCSERTKKTIEKTVQSVIGKCIRLVPGDKSTCNKRYLADNSVDYLGILNCTSYLSLKELKEHMNMCASDAFSLGVTKYPTHVVLRSSLQCFVKIADNNTCVRKESNEDYKSVLKMLLKFVNKYGDEDACKKNLQSSKAKMCYRNILDVISNLDKVDDGNVVEVLDKLVHCLNRGASECPEDAPKSLLAVLTLFWHNTHRTKEMMEQFSFNHNSGDFFPTISSIKQSDVGMELCTSQFPPMFDGNSLRPSFPDECVAINDDTNEGEPFYVILKSCSEQDVNTWLGTVKDCVEEKATNVGLRDPDYLNLQRTEMILMDCIDHRGPLKCRAKYHEDFRTILKSVFEMVRQNSLSGDDSDCKKELKLDNLPRCFQVLHKYLVLTNEKDQLQSAKGKASSCLQNSMKSCSEEILKSLMDVLELAMIADAENIKTYYGNDVQSCSPGEFAEQSSEISDTPSYLMCGKGGKLVKRSVKDLRDEKPLLSPERDDPEQKLCSAEEYKHYFDRLQKCSRKRLYLKFGRMKRKCQRSDMMIESWIAMRECMVENTEDELTCSFETEDQMLEYLYYVAKALHTNQQINLKRCPSSPRCYGENAPELHKCAEQYFKLLKIRESTDDMLEILKGTSKVLKCLGSLWPNCSSKLPLMTLTFAYRPLGMNYDSTIKEGLKFASCKVEKSHQENGFTFPDCMNPENGKEIQQGNSINSIESCIKCVRFKDGICSFKSINDIFQVINDGFSRLNHCFKNYTTNDDCLEEITTRMKNKCVPAIYGFFKNLNKGVVLNAVESFWNFNYCLVEFSGSECPDSFRRIAPGIYYEILGLGSYFKLLWEELNATESPL